MRTEAARRDWRWAVGTVGKVLIATGLLLFGFVGYQLWGTGIEYARAQDRLDAEFDRLLGATTTVTTPSTGPATGSPTTGTDPTGTDPTATDPTGTADPSSTVAPSTAPPIPVPDFAAGDVMARLEIPGIGVDTKVVSGVEPVDLKRGPGHYPDTPMPGQLGNSAVAGHRTTYGQPFFRLNEVQPGDEIVVTTVQGRFVYRATGSEVVDADRSDVVATVDPTVARLTLTTCHPRYSATRRLIVYADLDVAASSAPQPPIVDAAAPPASAAPAEPTLPGEPVSSTSATDPPATAPVGGASPSPGPQAAASDESADAFSHGWFSDDGAFVQVALWGLVLTAISIGAWQLSRRTGRDWVGALAGAVPFVVGAYFFFQNVNRLLPAAL